MNEWARPVAVVIAALIGLHWLTAGPSHIVNDRPVEDSSTSTTP